ncbi:Nitrogen regulatory protein P-II [Thermotoga neapolitana DSM 4359]|uniref:Nitrogen regulatory protein P-II n=2 Tax=Thermotoga neapolitana TaxID=2337 RepID=B9KBP6_THENN|nr:Nitrogen regulatory protein P-II [Thermotoga neapolitana DSM 4359]
MKSSPQDKGGGSMKLIIAVIQPHKLPDVKKALFDAQVYKMTVMNVLGCGQQKGYTETYRGEIEEVNLLKKVMLLIAVNEGFVEPTIEAIQKGARTGNIGDGKIFVLDLLDCIRIRTGERGREAIG